VANDKEIHVGDYGTIFEVTLIDPNTSSADDVSSANNKEFLFRNPAGTLTTVSGTFKTDGSDGIIQYTVLDGDSIIESTGPWSLQIRITSTAGQWTSEKENFTVFPNLDTT